MADSTPAHPIVRFGPFEMDRQAHELRRDGQRIPLQIQPFRVLQTLVDAAGQVVTRAELRDRIWPATVYIDFDHGLNNAINRLRQALDDSADQPRYIETLPRIGYRFIYALEETPQAASPLVSTFRRRSAVAFVALAAAIGLLLTWITMQQTNDSARATHEAAPAAALSDSAEANDAYHRGRALFERRNKESLLRSIDYLKRATELDPGFARAYAALAHAYITAGGKTLVHFLNPDEVRSEALAAAQRALQLDPDLAEGHTAMAGILVRLEPWSAQTDVIIEATYRHALELDAASSDAHLFFGNFLSSRGRSEEAMAHFRQAVSLEPLSPSANSRLGAELVASGKTAQGLQYLLKTLEIDPWQFNARLRLGWAYATLGRFNDAGAAFRAADAISPGSIQSLAGLAYVAAREGREQQAREMLETLEPAARAAQDPFSVAIVHVGLQDRENALRWLGDVAAQTRTLHKSGPFGIEAAVYDWLRDDPRFAEMEHDILGQNLARAAKTASP